MPYTFVCAESVPRAHRWCRANGVGPFERGTRIVTPYSPHGSRGCRLTPEDRVVVLVDEFDWNADLTWRYVRAALTPCGLGLTVSPEFVA